MLITGAVKWSLQRWCMFWTTFFSQENYLKKTLNWRLIPAELLSNWLIERLMILQKRCHSQSSKKLHAWCKDGWRSKMKMSAGKMCITISQSFVQVKLFLFTWGDKMLVFVFPGLCLQPTSQLWRCFVLRQTLKRWWVPMVTWLGCSQAGLSRPISKEFEVRVSQNKLQQWQTTYSQRRCQSRERLE